MDSNKTSIVQAKKIKVTIMMEQQRHLKNLKYQKAIYHKSNVIKH